MSELQDLLEQLVGKLAEVEEAGKKHILLRELCVSWGLTPAQALQLLLETSIALALDSKKDEASDEEIFEMLVGLFGRKVENARQGLVALARVKREYAAMQADRKKEGHA